MSMYWPPLSAEEETADRNGTHRPSPYPSSPRHFPPFPPGYSPPRPCVYGGPPPPSPDRPSPTPIANPWTEEKQAEYQAIVPDPLAQYYEQSGDEGQGAEMREQVEEEEEKPRPPSPSPAPPASPTPAPRAARTRRSRAPRPRARPAAAANTTTVPAAVPVSAPAAAPAATVVPAIVSALPSVVPAVAPAALPAANPAVSANAANTGQRPQLPPGFRYEGNFVVGHWFRRPVVVPEDHGETDRRSKGDERAPRGELHYCKTCSQWIWLPCFGRSGRTHSVCNHCSKRRWKRDNERRNVNVPDYVWVAANQPDVLHIKRNEDAYRP